MNVKIFKEKKQSEVAKQFMVTVKKQNQKLSARELQQEAEDVQAIEELAAKTGIAMPKTSEEPMPEAPVKLNPEPQKPKAIRKKATASPKTKVRQEEKPAKHESSKNARKVFLYEYSEKSVAVFGDTRPIKDTLKSMGGRFNRNLYPFGPDTAMPGWVFPAKMKEDLNAYINTL